jgi:hypothetical protein
LKNASDNDIEPRHARVCGSLGLGVPVRAVTIFNDFAAGYSTQLAGYCVDGASVAPACSGTGSLSPAALFESPGSYDLTQIDVALTYSEGTNSVVISLFTDVSGAPGALLGSWPESGQPVSSPPVTTISGISGITLANGATFYRYRPAEPVPRTAGVKITLVPLEISLTHRTVVWT